VQFGAVRLPLSVRDESLIHGSVSSRRGTLSDVASQKKRVHLFAGHTFIATRSTDRHRPAEYYVEAWHTYDVDSFQAIVDADGTDAFTAQVTLRA
jgi:hypothetical protein